MIAAVLLAAATSLPLGVWPAETGAAAATVNDVDFYLVDPEDDYSVVAVLPLAVPLEKAEPVELKRLAGVADKLGADAVILLGEMPEKMIPDDPDAPLPTTGRYSAAVFVSFDTAEGWQPNPVVPSSCRRRPGRHLGRWVGAARTAALGAANPHSHHRGWARDRSRPGP
jgi:hypothetical protein